MKSLLNFAKDFDYSSYSSMGRMAILDRTSLQRFAGIQDIRKFWMLEKIAKQSILATGIELKLDILSLDQIVSNDETDCTKFLIFNFRDGIDALPNDLINPFGHLASVGYSNDSVWAYKSNATYNPIPPLASHLSVFLGTELVSDQHIRFEWIRSKRSARTVVEKAGVLVIVSKPV